MAAPVQTPNIAITDYRVPPNQIQASKALTLKREIDILCSSQANDILRLAQQYPLNPATYSYDQPESNKDDEKQKGASNSASVLRASNPQKYTDILSIDLERMMPDYAHFIKHMYIPLEVLGIERQHYFKAIRAADFLHYPEALAFYTNKAVLDIEQQFLKIVKKIATIASSERGFMIFESHPIFSNERYARLMLEELGTLEFDVVHCPFAHVARKIRSPVVLWEMQRRGLTSVKHHVKFVEFQKEWDAIWNYFYRRNRYDIIEKSNEVIEKSSPPEYWQKKFLDRYFDAKLDTYTARISIPNLVLLLVAGHKLTKLILNVAQISTQELSKLFSNCPNIEMLTLTKYTASDLAALSNLPNLRQLVLKNSDLPSYWDREQIPSSVESLFIEDCDFDDAGFITLFKNQEVLNHLRLTNCPNLTDAGIKSVLKECRNLKNFTMIRCPKVDGSGLSTLSVRIERLHLENLKFNSESFEFFLKTHVALLIEIHLINLQGINEYALSPIWVQPPLNLTTLRIDGSPQLSTSKLKKLLSKLYNLTSLTIGKNDWINDHFIKYFHGHIIPTMPGLTSVDFSTCPHVTIQVLKP